MALAARVVNSVRIGSFSKLVLIYYSTDPLDDLNTDELYDLYTDELDDLNTGHLDDLNKYRSIT